MVTTKRAEVQNVSAAAKEIITPEMLIAELSGICETRQKAISMYPFAKNATEKFGVVQQIRVELHRAKQLPNWREQVKACLRLEYKLLFLAPTSTFKIYNTYVQKVAAYMASCRECLGWRAQS